MNTGQRLEELNMCLNCQMQADVLVLKGEEPYFVGYCNSCSPQPDYNGLPLCKIPIKELKKCQDCDNDAVMVDLNRLEGIQNGRLEIVRLCQQCVNEVEYILEPVRLYIKKLKDEQENTD